MASSLPPCGASPEHTGELHGQLPRTAHQSDQRGRPSQLYPGYPVGLDDATCAGCAFSPWRAASPASIYYGFLVSDDISAMWEFIFTMVNAIQLAIVLMAGRRKSRDEDEALFIETVMPMLDGNLRASMLKLARWETREPGEVLVEEGQTSPQLVFIARGAASVEKGGRNRRGVRTRRFPRRNELSHRQARLGNGACRQRDPLLCLRSCGTEGA